MKKLSKVLSVICALVLVAGLGVTAFAAGSVASKDGVNIESVDPEGNTCAPLTAEVIVSLPNDPETKYSVNVAWEDLVLVYGGGSEPEAWNPATHTYGVPGTAGTWTNPSADITITNNSNVGVTATTTYESTTGYEDGKANANGITVDVSGASFETPAQLAAGDENNAPVGDGTDNQAVVSVTASGTPKEKVTVDVGTITVAITAAAAA